MCDIVNNDLTRTPLNRFKNEVQTGMKVQLMKIGHLFTDQVSGTPTFGAPAYLANNGKFTPTQTNATANPRVGRFTSSKDADNFVGVEIDLNG